MSAHARTPDLDQISHDIAHALQAAPAGTQAQTGADPQAFAAQLRPHLTAEMASAAMVGGKFNLKKFLENLGNAYNAVAPLITIISTLVGKPVTLPPITLPTGQALVPPAGAQ